MWFLFSGVNVVNIGASIKLINSTDCNHDPQYLNEESLKSSSKSRYKETKKVPNIQFRALLEHPVALMEVISIKGKDKSSLGNTSSSLNCFYVDN